MTFPSLPVGARTTPTRFDSPPKKEVIHHFVQTYEIGKYTSRGIRTELWVFTKPYDIVKQGDFGPYIAKRHKAEWVKLSTMTEWDIYTRTPHLQFKELASNATKEFTCLLSLEEPVWLYWPITDTIYVLATKGPWTPQEKEVWMNNERFHI